MSNNEPHEEINDQVNSDIEENQEDVVSPPVLHRVATQQEPSEFENMKKSFHVHQTKIFIPLQMTQSNHLNWERRQLEKETKQKKKERTGSSFVFSLRGSNSKMKVSQKSSTPTSAPYSYVEPLDPIIDWSSSEEAYEGESSHSRKSTTTMTKEKQTSTSVTKTEASLKANVNAATAQDNKPKRKRSRDRITKFLDLLVLFRQEKVAKIADPHEREQTEASFRSYEKDFETFLKRKFSK